MKPFRGKPEKPERSNGEIQRVSSASECWTLGDGHGLRSDASLRPRSMCRGDELVHFSPSRTSRPVGCRPKDRGGDRVAPSGCFRSDPRLPACSPDGIVVARGRDNLIRVRPVASACGYLVGVWGLVPRLHRTRSTAGDGVLGQTPLYARRRRFSFGYFQDPS